MGLPQSMQNFDVGSFSRPQTAQRVDKSVRAGESGEYMDCDRAAGEGAGGVRRPASGRRLGAVTYPRALLLLRRLARLCAGLCVSLCGSLLGGALAPLAAHAQVRPQLAWRTLRTDHFRIHYTDELETLARRTAANAEFAYARLSDELVPPRGTIDIVVADNVDYANGYATPYPTNRIVIYARPPVEELALRNHADWNALLVTHELTHIFHLDRVRGLWALAQRVFGRAAPFFPNSYAPSWIVEGLAVHYETAITGGGRLAGSEFPAYVRAAAIAGELPPLDALSLESPRFPGGNRAYLYGSYAVTRGDTARMGRLVEASSGRLIPWRHDASARDAFGESFTARWAAWRDSVTRDLATRDVAGTAPEGGDGASLAAITTLTRHGFTARFPRFTGNAALVYVANDARSTTGLYTLSLNGDRARLGRRNSLDVSTPLPGSGSVQGELEYADPYSLRSDLYRGDGLRRRRLTREQRLSSPDAHGASGRVVAVRTDPGTTSLVLVDPSDGWVTRDLALGSLDRTWAEPRLSRSGEEVAAVRWDRGGRSSVVTMDLGGRERQRFAPRGPRISVVSSPVWEPGDSTLLFVSDHEGRPMIYRGDVRSGAYGRVWSTPTALNTPDVSPDGRHIAAVELRSDGYHVVVRETPGAGSGAVPSTVPLALPDVDRSADPLRPVGAAPIDTAARSSRYSAWKTSIPTWWLPVVRTTDPGTTAFGFMTGARDVVGRHSWSAEASFETARQEVTSYLTYAWAGLGVPVVRADYSNEWQHALIRTNAGAFAGYLGQRSRRGALNVVFERPRVRLSSYLVLGGELEAIDHRSYPGSLLPLLGNDVLLGVIHTQALHATAGVSTMQRPANAVSVEDGVSLAVTHRARFGVGLRSEDVTQTIVAGSAAKSLPLPGFARHVIAVRGAYGVTGHRTTSAFDVGGVSGSSLEVVPGFVIGGSARTFGVRGFDGGTLLGVRAMAGSVEYRAPLALIGRGVGLLPLFFQKTSVTAFVDRGAAWCEFAVADSFICRAPVLERQWIGSVGAELGVDASLQYDRAYRFRLGIAHPTEGAGFARKSNTVYFSLGSSF